MTTARPLTFAGSLIHLRRRISNPLGRLSSWTNQTLLLLPSDFDCLITGVISRTVKTSELVRTAIRRRKPRANAHTGLSSFSSCLLHTKRNLHMHDISQVRLLLLKYLRTATGDLWDVIGVVLSVRFRFPNYSTQTIARISRSVVRCVRPCGLSVAARSHRCSSSRNTKWQSYRVDLIMLKARDSYEPNHHSK